MIIRRCVRLALVAAVALLVGAGAAFAQEEKAAERDRDALEKEFKESLTGATLVGHYSVEGKPEVKGEEKYTIAEVAKQKDDIWLFVARIQYGERDLTVPIPLRVEWAGDTPVITLTDLTIPGLGTFTARVLIYRGRYAGTWQHGEVGGSLWGVVKKAGADKEE